MEKIEIVPGSIHFLKMSDEEYFSEKYKSYVSNSKLGMLNPQEGGSLEKFKEGFKSEYSASFELGSAVHAMILQPELYEISNIRKPGGKLGLFVEKVFELRKEGYPIYEAILEASETANYYSGKLSDKRLKTAIKTALPFYLQRLKVKESIDKTTIFLSENMGNQYESCANSLLTNQTAMKCLKPKGLLMDPIVFNEYAILCQLKVTLDTGEEVIIGFKGKLDNVTVDEEENKVILNDLKTTGKPVKFFMGNHVKVINDNKEETVWYNGSFQKYHYYRQMGTYLFLLQAAINERYNKSFKYSSNMVVVETIPNFSSKVYPVGNKMIKAGLDEFKKLIIILAEWKLQGLIN